MVLSVSPAAEIDVFHTVLMMAKGGYGWEDCCVELRRQGATFSPHYVMQLVLNPDRVRKAWADK